MSPPTPTLLDWFTQHAGFPARRLTSGVELLLLFAAAAQADEVAARAKVPRGPNPHLEKAQVVSQKQLAENRRHAHFKCDNRTAV